MFRIIRREEKANGSIITNEIEAPQIARKARPGQFVILMANETGERIPLTLADFDPVRGTITVIYSVVGRSTALFSELLVGDSYRDVVGPLGTPSELEKVGTALCIGGGAGVAVIYPIARGLKEMGNRVITILGARTAERLILEPEMKAVSDEFLVCTDDGSYGRKGLVTDLLVEVLAREKPDLVVAIGPVPMMKRICDITLAFGIKTRVSLNPIMIDGTGMCGSCRVVVDGKTRFACVDGPEFDGHKVDFDQLMQRLQSCRTEEIKSVEAHGLVHKCNMEKLVAPLAGQKSGS
ncbi:MAG: sulfide/dihydroorotate dehydrogenase-like FAD/NAD-binding protein [Methanotrichaceae archaeon]|nr:sulfide/dihydroorotate dehydrogenase-like FAD/NAD-binding protein [Methanotrichaceae archaeon]